MSDVAYWLSSRRPGAPGDLAEALRAAVGGGGLVEVLAEAGLDRLRSARDATGRVRESAFRLLEADALLTYACEAALESEAPPEELRRILSAVGS